MLAWLAGSLAQSKEKTAPVSAVYVCPTLAYVYNEQVSHVLTLLYTEDVSETHGK